MKESGFIINTSIIENKIFTIRGVQVILDKDIAKYYNVEIKRLNEQVKRNKNRFPEDFCFQLTELEYTKLRSQNATLNDLDFSLRSQNATLEKGQHRKYLPYVFTEEGVAAVSAIIKNEIAAEVSVMIMRAFVNMRKFILHNAVLFDRLDRIEYKQIEAENKFEQIFKELENKDSKVSQGVFFDGQVFDAYSFISKIIKSANKSIVLIDNYIDDSVLIMLSKKKSVVICTIMTKNISDKLRLDVNKFNMQYPVLEIVLFNKSHDRFLIIDDTEVYHVGASLKDLGKKWFAFTKLDSSSVTILSQVREYLVNLHSH